MEHFEDDDDNNNDSDDIEDVSVHGSWGNTSLSPAASNIIVACDCGLPLHPAVPRVILNDLGERSNEKWRKRSASYFLGIQSIQVGSLTSLLDHSGELFMALACL